MLDITARDFAARNAQWDTPQGPVPLPTILHPHTPNHPAPANTHIAIGHEPANDTPTIRFTGTRFDPTPATEPDAWSLPKALLYPGSLDDALHSSADEINPNGPIRIHHNLHTLTPHEGLLILTTARRVADDPWRLADFLTTARQQAGPNAILYTPGIGRPDQLALAAYAGVDLFDGLAPILEGLNRRLLTPDGPLDAAQLTEPACPCPACQQADWTTPVKRETLIQHNQHAANAEAARIRHAVTTGSLRELVETRARTRPEHVATLRRYDTDHAAFFETQAPSVRTRQLPVLSRRSLDRPEIQRWMTRLETRYTPPSSANVLIALPCSATKPYQNSPTHQRIRPSIENNAHGRAHIVTLTSPLGAVPEELELAYPAAHYDVPVTGDWTPEEVEQIQTAYQHIWKNGDYDTAILHLSPDEADILDPILPHATRTVHRGERPTDTAPKNRLADAVHEAIKGLDATARTDLFMEHMRGRIDWQFGPDTSDILAQDTEIRGRYPYLKLMHNDTQLLMLKPERGALTLTFEGGQRLHQTTDAFTIHIDDFTPKGDVFAPGVLDASDTIRIEDEVLITHDDELRAVGRAQAPGPEMARMQHGSCAEVRHHA